MRKIVKEFDGARFTLAPLNLDQVDKFITTKDGSIRTIDLLLMSLNNAEPGEPWTEEKLRKELDLVLQGELQTAVLEISGLKAVEAGASPGETKAAGATGSGKPAAA